MLKVIEVKPVHNKQLLCMRTAQEPLILRMGFSSSERIGAGANQGWGKLEEITWEGDSPIYYNPDLCLYFSWARVQS